MKENFRYDEDDHWVIWNGSYGIVDTVELGRIERVENIRHAWLDEPYEIVGPFNLNELETQGRIDFAQCSVMSRQRWQEDQVALRRESLHKRRETQARLFEELSHFNARKNHLHQFSQKRYRELLDLPLDEDVTSSQIKTAYRKIAKNAHPDVGGSHEAFVQLTQARDALLECFE